MGASDLISVNCMSRREARLFLLKSFPDMRVRQFHTGEEIPESGIYRVIHRAHRLPHSVTLLSGQSFPRCAKCRDSVCFELIHAAPAISTSVNDFKVHLYELPVVDDLDGALAVG